MPPHISHWHPFYLYSWNVFFVDTRIKLLVAHFPIGKGDVPKIQKARACESPGFSVILCSHPPLTLSSLSYFRGNVQNELIEKNLLTCYDKEFY